MPRVCARHQVARVVEILRTEGFQSNPFVRLHFALIWETHVICMVLQIVPMKRLTFHLNGGAIDQFRQSVWKSLIRSSTSE